MIYPIEYEAKKAWAVQSPIKGVSFALYEMDAPEAFGVVPDGETLMVCSWCVPPSEQQPLKDAGFNLSHGICRHCFERQTKKEQSYEQTYQ